MTEKQDDTALEVTGTPLGSIKVRGTDLVSVLTVIFVAVIGYILFQHLVDTRQQTLQFVGAVNELTSAQRDAAKQQRLLTCIVSRPEAERKREFGDSNSFCQQVTQFPGR